MNSPEPVAKHIGADLLSVVIPTVSDTNCNLLSRSISCLKKLSSVELIFVSQSEAHSRAERLNIGMHRSHGNIVLFHHPRTYLDPKGIEYLIKLSEANSEQSIWGGFTHCFDNDHFLLRFTSWYSNNIRARRRGIVYLDHCIFFKRELWHHDLPKVDIFEDTLLSQFLRKKAPPVILPYQSTTSSIRFQKNGILKQSLINQILKLAFYLKFSDRLMNRFYEKQLSLNSTYKNGVPKLTESEPQKNS